MTTREHFGPYVLLKKLTEDPLGETFRAGMLSPQGIDQVVLLKVFNGQGIDSAELWQRMAQREGVQPVLRSPNIATGAGVGEIQGVPYIAYDYVSGKDLATLVEQADRQSSPLPEDHALLIAERIALGLSAAYETRLAGQRVVHGFVVPELVMLSNEGETKLLGFEVAPGLRDLAPTSASLSAFARFLSPETLAGEPLTKADDVYSMGSLLFELLTGRPLPLAVAGGSPDAAIDQATLAELGEPLTPDLARFLKQSLLPRAQRIPDAAAWHKALSQLMVEAQHNPTTFNLAFFMHSVLKDDIERESRELQGEQNLAPSELTGEFPIASTAAGAVTVEAAARDNETVMISTAEIDTQAVRSGPPRALVAGLAAAALLVAAAVIAWAVFFRGTADEPSTTAQPLTIPVQAPPPPPAGPTQEEMQAELEKLKQEMAESLTSQGEEMRKELARQYDSRLATLQAEYEAAQKAQQEQAEAEAAAAIEPPAEQAGADPDTQIAEVDTDAGLQENGSGEDGSGAASLTTDSGTAPATSSGQEPTELASNTPAGIGPGSSESESGSTLPPPQKAPPPPPEKPRVQLGDLVDPGPGVVQPVVLKRARARYPEVARRVGKTGTVAVRALVDHSGQVIKTELVGDKLGMGLDQAALDAARNTTYKPATKNGVRVKMWTLIRFDFEG